MFDLIRDVRYAARRLTRTPVFTLATLLMLALGIGANTAIFSVVNTVLLKPLPYPQPDRLVGLWQTAPGVNIDSLNASIADYITYREESKTLADVAIWDRNAYTVTGIAEPEQVDAIMATHRLLPMLGVQPILGRAFTERDDQEGSPPVVMLGYGYWQRRFGGDPAAVGRRLTLDGTPLEIIGVLPQRFWHMDARHDLVVPVRIDRAKVHLAGYNFEGIGRLRPMVTLDALNADVARMIRVAFGKFPPPQGMSLKMLEDARLGPNARPLINDLVGDFGKTLWVLMATIGIVLLIACANVANLMLVRTEGRAQELAVRAAIGAGRGRLAREMLTESLLLAVVGGAAGLGLAAGAIKLVLSLSPARLPRFDLIAIDGTSVLFTLVLSVVAGLAFGAIPVLKRGRIRLAEALRSGGRNASAGRDRNITRNTLTIIQVALAVVLLIGSGLMIRTLQSMRRVQPDAADAAYRHLRRRRRRRCHAADPAADPDRSSSRPPRHSGGRHDQRAADDRFHVAGPDLRQRPRLHRQRHPAAASLHPDGPWHVPSDGHTARRGARVQLDRPSPEPPGGPDQRELRA
jgi:predicted permease